MYADLLEFLQEVTEYSIMALAEAYGDDDDYYDRNYRLDWSIVLDDEDCDFIISEQFNCGEDWQDREQQMLVFQYLPIVFTKDEKLDVCATLLKEIKRCIRITYSND